MPKIGFACKFIGNDSQISGVGSGDPEKALNTRSTTAAWCARQYPSVAESRLWELMQYNIESIRLLVSQVTTMPAPQRMVRLSSEILPLYTHHLWKDFWKRDDVQQYCARHFLAVGNIARAAGVRLSFHPGQFCVLASDRPEVVESSIEEFEYHADMARWMGYGQQFQDFKINVHIGGRLGPNGILATYERLSDVAKNTITIENDENSWGLDSCLELAHRIPIVLDVHHHFVNTGEYISPTDSRVTQVVESWRGITPTMHLSQTRETFLTQHCINTLPCKDALLKAGVNKQKLRAHSDYLWNSAVNEWALQFLDKFDIMVEAKAKNLAASRFYQLTGL